MLDKMPTIFERLSSDSSRSYVSFFIGLAVFVTGTLATYVAQSADRPVSAALIYVSAVTIIGAVNGLRGGLLAGIGASFFYNFFFSEPLLDFGVTTSDEYIPLLAFNLSALLSGALAGRINDRARAAEIAQQKINLLLDISNQLQTAVHLEDIDRAIVQTGIFDSSQEFEIYAISDEEWIAVDGKKQWLAEAQQAVGQGELLHIQDQKIAYLLSSSQRRVGVLICTQDAQKSKRLSKIGNRSFCSAPSEIRSRSDAPVRGIQDRAAFFHIARYAHPACSYLCIRVEPCILWRSVARRFSQRHVDDYPGPVRALEPLYNQSAESGQTSGRHFTRPAGKPGSGRNAGFGCQHRQNAP